MQRLLEYTKGKGRIDMNIFKKFKCEKCLKKFRQQEELMHHELIAHESSLYDCKECNQFFLKHGTNANTHAKKTLVQ